MTTESILKKDCDLFIVYQYNSQKSNKTKYVMGIYDTKENALIRQEELSSYYNESSRKYLSDKGDVIFINKLKFGDSNIALFTTNIS